jgi:RmlD substrate binding domain
MTSAGKRKPRNARASVINGALDRGSTGAPLLPAHGPPLNATEPLVDGEKGVWHLANAGEATWAELAREAARALRLDPRLVLAVPAAELGWAARRPRRSVLGSGRGGPLPPLGAALACHAAAFRAGGPPRVSVGDFLTRYRPPG